MKQLHPKAIWLFFFGRLIPFIFFILPLLGFIYIWNNFDFPDGITWLGGIIFVIILLYFWSWLTYRYYRYEFTEMAFKKEHGIIWKKYVSIPYDRVQNVDIYRGVIARLLGLSDLQIQTAGGIAAGSYGAFAEGRLPGLTKEEAERLREELILRVQRSKGQGL